MGLYLSGYRPARLPVRYTASGITISGEGQAADIMRRLGVPEGFGDPIDAVAFFDDDSGVCQALVCDYANGRRAEYRRTRSGGRLSVMTPEKRP